MFNITQECLDSLECGTQVSIGDSYYVVMKIRKNKKNENIVNLKVLSVNHTASILLGGKYEDTIEVNIINSNNNEQSHYFNLIREPSFDERMEFLKDIITMPTLQNSREKTYVMAAGINNLEEIKGNEL